MNELIITGGAKIGMTSSSWPFATLRVTEDQLILKVFIIGNLTFQASDIISIEPYVLIPFLGQGIKINHMVADYKKRIIFYTFKNPEVVIKQIEAIGFIGDRDIYV